MTIVAACELHLAAATLVSQDVPVAGGTAALARALGVDPVPDRGRFIAEITRLVYDTEARNPAAAAFLQTLRQPAPRGKRAAVAVGDGSSELVPVPLTAEVWGNAIFRRRVAPDELVTAIIADRQASLLCHGLAALDDETLQFLVEHSSLLSRLYERAAPAFAVFSGRVHIRANRVVPPGGADAVPLWESVVGEKVSRPERFVLALFELNEGRIAYLYDIVGHLDPARRKFVLGLWMNDAAVRLDRFRALATAGIGTFKEWHLRVMPYGRSPWDLAMTLMRVEVTETGAPAPPASRTLWARVFASTELPEEGATAHQELDDAPFDAAWLVATVGDSEIRRRVERLDQIGLAQRVFGASTAADASALLVALRGLPRYRMLILTLERIGVRTPALFAAAARHADRLAPVDGARGFVAQAQFQGALALVARLADVQTIDAEKAGALIGRLVALPISDEGRYAGAIARWLRDDVGAAIGAGDDVERAVIAALGGRSSGSTGGVRLVWEGQQYRLDLGFAERRRLQRVREKQAGPPIDVALQIAAIARRLSDGALPLGDIETTATRLTKLGGDLARRTEEGAAAPAAGRMLDGTEVVRKTVDELTRIARSRDVKRETRLADPLVDLADELLARTLLSLAYAVHVGDPEGTVLLAGDTSYRHDFGFTVKDSTMRARAFWTVPRQEVSPGVPWHVSGSLLGLDIALAPLALRRMNFDHLTGAPKLTSNERDTFAVSVSLMNPYMLRDADLDAIAAALPRGRMRVLAMAEAPGTFDAVADAIGMDGSRRRALRWTLAHEPDSLVSMFSLTELLFLGHPAGVAVASDSSRAPGNALNDWGMAALTTAGCICTRLTPPGRWWLLVGRAQLGIIASGVADLNLHVAVRLKELQLPAALAKTVLAGAMQDLIDGVRPSDAADWLTLARTARTATREQIEDYLAAATADGPLVPDTTPPDAERR